MPQHYRYIAEDDRYSYADTGIDDEPRTPSSVRRYRPLQQHPRTTAHYAPHQYFVEDEDDEEEYPSYPPQRRHEPTRSIRPVSRVPQTTQAHDQKLTRRQILFGAKVSGTVAIAAAVIEGLSWARSGIVTRVLDRWDQGMQRSVSLRLVCGHQDSPASPTILHAFIESGCLYVLELPGGDDRKAHITQSESFRSSGYAGDLSQARIRIAPEKINNKYRVHVQVDLGDISLLGNRQQVHLYLEDKGGYFQPA